MTLADALDPQKRAVSEDSPATATPETASSLEVERHNHQQALDACDALIAERDEARRERDHAQARYEVAWQQRDKLEVEVERLKKSLDYWCDNEAVWKLEGERDKVRQITERNAGLRAALNFIASDCHTRATMVDYAREALEKWAPK